MGVEMQDGVKLRSKSVVLTTGTFLAAQCHIGLESMPAGRFMRHTDKDRENNVGLKFEPPSNALAASIKRLNFPVSRLRTGTPPRLSKKTIDYTGLES